MLQPPRASAGTVLATPPVTHPTLMHCVAAVYAARSIQWGPERAFDGGIDTHGNEAALTQAAELRWTDYAWAQWTLDRV